MTGMKPTGRNWKKKRIWFGSGVIVVGVMAASVTFAVMHTNGSSKPSDVASGNVQPQSNVLISDECGTTNDEGLYEPAAIQLTCGDGTIEAGNLSWSQWGSTVAVGEGTVNEVSCVPNCVNGKDIAYAAKLTLSEAVKAGNGKEYFTRIVVSFIGHGPNGSSSQLFKDCFDTSPAPYIPACPADEQGAN